MLAAAALAHTREADVLAAVPEAVAPKADLPQVATEALGLDGHAVLAAVPEAAALGMGMDGHNALCGGAVRTTAAPEQSRGGVEQRWTLGGVAAR